MHGDRHAENELFRLVYPALSRIASRLLHRRRNKQPDLSSNDLVHEVYLKCMREWRGNISERNHYLAVFTTAMKNQLIDRARRARTKKRTAPDGSGFPFKRVTALDYEEIVALERELKRLEAVDFRAAQVVSLRYFAGCSWEETAAALASTLKTARMDWEFASKWLGERLGHKSS